MAFEDVALFGAWAIVLMTLVCLLPRALGRRAAEAPEGSLLREDAFFDVGGPVIDADPA